MIPTWLYIYLGLSAVILIVAGLAIRYLNYRNLVEQPTVLLELTPPRTIRKTNFSTSEFFSIIHQHISGMTFHDRLFNRKTHVSFEVVSTRREGIRYLVRLPKAEVTLFQQQISAYVPNIHFREIEDYVQGSLGHAEWMTVKDYKQRRHFAYSLAEQDSLSQHDPIAYITGAMTKLADDELLVLQLVLSPADTRQATKIANQLLVKNEARLPKVQWPLPVRVIGFVFRIALGFIRTVLEFIGEITRPRYELPKYQQQPGHAITSARQAVIDAQLNKLSQPLFQVSIRTLSLGQTKQLSAQRSRGLDTALGTLSVSGYQGLYARRGYGQRGHTYRLNSFAHRMPTLFASFSNILSNSEVAALFHFPYAGTTEVENMATSHSRTLPAPLSLKNGSKLDVIIGENKHHGQVTPIGLTSAERERHVYIIGGTGNGKTTMVQYAIAQDMQAGKGLAVIDPHGDMAETLLSHVPTERLGDVIYFNPDDLAHPVSMNLLELTSGLEGDELLREKDLVTEAVVSIFRKIFSDDDSGGHRIEYVLRNTIQTALSTENPTLFTMFNLLNDREYRKRVVAQLDNKDLVNFWNNELGKAGNFQQVKMVAGITAKIGRFLFSASAKRVLEQPKSTINFDEILNGKILICNFSKGLLGEDTSELFGVAILAKLQLASLRRARVTQAERKSFYLYVDEFQNFATPSFVQMLSEARKYKVYLTMAEQTTSQQDDQKMVNIILANVGTVICFRSGNPADEKLVLPLFEPYITKGEIANLPSYNFYLRILAQKPQEPLSGETIVLEAGNQSKGKVIQTSRKYATKPVKQPSKPKDRVKPKVKQKAKRLGD